MPQHHASPMYNSPPSVMTMKSRPRCSHTLAPLATHSVSSLDRRALGRSAARVSSSCEPVVGDGGPALVTSGASNKPAQVIAARGGRIGRSWREISPRVVGSGRESARRLNRRRYERPWCVRLLGRAAGVGHASDLAWVGAMGLGFWLSWERQGWE